MASGMDFTDKAQETLAAAVQIAKDYAQSQGAYTVTSHANARVTNFRISVHPAHIAFALLNEGAGQPGANSLFTSVLVSEGDKCYFCSIG